MSMQRRGFLGAILAAGVAPAFVGSSVLMPVRKVLAAPAIIAPTSTILAAGAGLMDGDLFTIAGVAGTFRVVGAPQGGVINLAMCKSPSLIDRLMARIS